MRMRPFFLFRLRARADFNLAFCPGGMKNACFLASLIISSVITLRLKRRNALSIDSPWLTVTIAILSVLSFSQSVLFRDRYLTRHQCFRSSSQRQTGRLTQSNPALRQLLAG